MKVTVTITVTEESTATARMEQKMKPRIRAQLRERAIKIWGSTCEKGERKLSSFAAVLHSDVPTDVEQKCCKRVERLRSVRLAICRIDTRLKEEKRKLTIKALHENKAHGDKSQEVSNRWDGSNGVEPNFRNWRLNFAIVRAIFEVFTWVTYSLTMRVEWKSCSAGIIVCWLVVWSLKQESKTNEGNSRTSEEKRKWENLEGEQRTINRGASALMVLNQTVFLPSFTLPRPGWISWLPDAGWCVG